MIEVSQDEYDKLLRKFGSYSNIDGEQGPDGWWRVQVPWRSRAKVLGIKGLAK